MLVIQGGALEHWRRIWNTNQPERLNKEI